MVTTSTAYPKDLESLLETMSDLSPNNRSIIERAYHKAEAAHTGQRRKSGEPYFTHCVAVAGILADLKLDAEAVAAGLLHDIVEDTEVTLDELRSEFGDVIARLVEGVTKLAKLPGLKADNNRQARSTSRDKEYFRKMLLTMNDDVRAVLVKLADRLHNMRTLGFMSESKQQRIAQETMDIFAPLANRLGIWQMKWELEDLSFRYLQPEAYRAIAKSLDERRADRERYVAHIAEVLQAELEAHYIDNFLITARPKHIYSIYRKMKKKDLPLEQIYDVRAVRVIVPETTQCYTVLGIVHKLWRPIPGEFDDYIAAPKDNFYRSLHTGVLDENGKTVEVQIRTWQMHEDAEYGIAAHWRYKEGRRAGTDEAFEKRVEYLRRLMDAQDKGDEDAEAFLDRVKSEVFQDRVYAFTPKGDIIDLPVGATPIDFAYHIHTEIGHRCRGAKVGGRLVSLDYQLKTGEQIEIITAKRGGPSMDWLNADLGYVNTHRARLKVRHWFRKQNRNKHIVMGRDALNRELKRMGLLDKLSFDAITHLMHYDHVDDLLAAIGSGDVTGAQITQRVFEDERRREREAKTDLDLIKPQIRTNASVDVSNGVSVLGAGGLLVNIARCCGPVPGDNIIGYVTRGRGVTVHREDCSNIAGVTDPERLIEVSWGHANEAQRYTVPVEIVAHDREGLLRDISTLVADQKINMSSVEVVTRSHIATLYIGLDVIDNRQLLRVLSRIEGIPQVYEARRLTQT